MEMLISQFYENVGGYINKMSISIEIPEKPMNLQKLFQFKEKCFFTVLFTIMVLF